MARRRVIAMSHPPSKMTATIRTKATQLQAISVGLILCQYRTAARWLFLDSGQVQGSVWDDRTTQRKQSKPCRMLAGNAVLSGREEREKKGKKKEKKRKRVFVRARETRRMRTKGWEGGGCKAREIGVYFKKGASCRTGWLGWARLLRGRSRPGCRRPQSTHHIIIVALPRRAIHSGGNPTT